MTAHPHGGSDLIDPSEGDLLNPFVQVPQRALDIWRARVDLQAAFDPATAQGRSGLVWWYFLNGFRELGLFLMPGDGKDFLNQPEPGLKQRSWAPVSQLMAELDRRRRAARRQSTKSAGRGGQLGALARRIRRRWEALVHPLRFAGTQTKLLAWYFTRGLAEANLLELLDEDQAAALLAPSGPARSLPRIVGLVWDADKELQSRFPNRNDPQILQWCAENGRTRWPILAHPKIGLAPPRPRSPAGRPALPFGVNLFGHARARLGVGEDVRMAARALENAGVPFGVHDVAAGSIAAEEFALETRIGEGMPYAFNLFCMTGMETVTTVLARGRGIFERHVNIGFWPWELPRWPQFWHHAYHYVDEVWASTGFAEEALRSSAPCPVHRMPMAVSVEESEGMGRRDFGLDEDRFWFAFAFDGLSSFRRKNPLACVSAFLQAFPDPTTPVGLVLKGLRVEDHPDWQTLAALAKFEPRIRLLTGSYSRGALLDLYRSIDCFVSLHRSEGFGRNIAEAMMLGKPVIATGFSGNTDFTRSDTALLVTYREAVLGQGDYPFGEGQRWADPDLNHAADQMRCLFADAVLREKLAEAGQNCVNSIYAPDIVGQSYRTELTRRYRHGVDCGRF